MAVYGGSHSSFDAGAFGVGAITGATALASALTTGITNGIECLRSAREADYLTWTAYQLRRALILSEAFRLRDLEGYQIAVETIADRGAEIRTLKRELAVERARNSRR